MGSGRFSWAIPDERAIRILHHFSPVVEIGAGDGYWAGLVEAAGGDVLAFDIAAAGAAGNSAKDKQMISRKGRGELAHVKGPVVAAGGPEVLLRPECVGRALVLCYPDEYEFNDESLGNACLDTFQGGAPPH